MPNWKENSIRLKNVHVKRSFEHLPPEQRDTIERTHLKFDVTLDTLEVKLSFLRLWEGVGAPRCFRARLLVSKVE